MANERRKKPAQEQSTKKAAKKQSSPQQGRTPGGESKDPRALQFEHDLWRNLDRLNQVVAKSIDLAEASIVLGVRMVSGLGKLGHEQILNRAMETAGTPRQGEAVQTEPYGQATGHPEPSAPVPSVTNRAPLHPGSDVYLSFSLTNDSAEGVKVVKLSLEGLVGEARGAQLAMGALRITPPEGRLAPLDFEKFVIRGTIPGDTTPDTYAGTILVEGEERLAIPLRLAVI